jgi:hypothetical protein
MDIVSVHFYNKEGYNTRLGITGHTNADLLRIIKQTTDELDKKLFVGEFGDQNPYIESDKRALFTQNVLDKIVELKIPYSAPWVWEYYQRTPYSQDRYSLEPGGTDLIISKIKEANAKLGNRIPSPQPRDTTAPRVVVTWPLDGRLSCNQLVYAVASDDSGTISEVRFLVNDNFRTIVSIPPYRLNLDTARLGLFREQRIIARAYDRSGNVGEYAVSVKPNLCFQERLSQLLK